MTTSENKPAAPESPQYALVADAPPRHIFRPGMQGDRLSARELSFADLQPNGAQAPFPVRLQGDWVYSDPSNPGVALLDLTAPGALSGDTYQPNAFTLRPGEVFKFPQRDCSVGVALVTARVKLIYGTGECPFESSYSGHASALGGLQAGTGIPLVQSIPFMGVLDYVSIRVRRVTAAAETSRLRPSLTFQNAAGFTSGAIYPDTLVADDVAVAGVGIANAIAVWRNLPIPQLVSGGAPVFFDRIVILADDLGNAVTNPITRTGNNDGFLLR